MSNMRKPLDEKKKRKKKRPKGSFRMENNNHTGSKNFLEGENCSILIPSYAGVEVKQAMIGGQRQYVPMEAA
ncbi:hypothetical protein TNCT_475271 [Trichonephila clavata]|uniref:Uncharacterized protein n=1 Tax=Trichonephila clavata TaxID=2740835 RepID=A0A8X6ISA6_TRICU|nr:hypothetical protein TNCT_475271 [Trichonephila clavata]